MEVMEVFDTALLRGHYHVVLSKPLGKEKLMLPKTPQNTQDLGSLG